MILYLKFLLMKSLKKYLIIGAMAIAGFSWYGFSNDLFEITKNLELFNSLYRDVNIYYVDETNPGELVTTGIDAM